MQPLEISYAINRAFTAQSAHFDADETGNPVLANWRQQIYRHVAAYLQPNSSILELNAGTGIDAVHFAAKGHHVLATDSSDGMFLQLEQKAKGNPRITVRKLSFENLDALNGHKFDFVFSNFGGLNCTDNLSRVTLHLPALLKPGAHVTLVVMPPICPWEWLWLLKGKRKQAFRRFSSDGADANIDGVSIKTFYHSRSSVEAALGGFFKLVRAEGLGIFSPPPSATSFVSCYPRLHSILKRMDDLVRGITPFNRFGDHIVVTYQYRP